MITSTKKTTGARTMEPMKMPDIKPQKGLEIETSEGTVHISITILDEKPYEVFITTPVESSHSEVYEALARIFSVSLRCGVPANLLLQQIEDANKKYGSVVSPTYAILRAARNAAPAATVSADIMIATAPYTVAFHSRSPIAHRLILYRHMVKIRTTGLACGCGVQYGAGVRHTL